MHLITKRSRWGTPRVHRAIIEFLTVVKDQNTEFLELCVQTYEQKLHVAGKDSTDGNIPILSDSERLSELRV